MKLHYGSKRSEVEQKLHHGERNYIMGSEIERKYIMEERNRVMGSEITSWEAKLHYEK